MNFIILSLTYFLLLNEMDKPKEYIVSVSNDTDAMIYDISGRLVRILPEQKDGIIALAIDKTGNYILTGSFDGRTILYDINSNTRMGSFYTPNKYTIDYVMGVAFHPNGLEFITALSNKTVEIWSIVKRAMRTIEVHEGMVRAVKISKTGDYFVTGSDDKTAKLWDFKTGQRVAKYQEQSLITDVDISNDERFVATSSYDSSVKVYYATYAMLKAELKGHKNTVQAVKFFKNDSNKILSGSADHTARVWNVDQKRTIMVFNGHTDVINAVDLTDDGLLALTGSGDMTVKMWTVNTGFNIRTFYKHKDVVTGVKFMNVLPKKILSQVNVQVTDQSKEDELKENWDYIE